MNNQEQSQEQSNPHIAEPNPYADRQAAIDSSVTEHPELQELGRICYEIFMQNKDGVKLFELMQSRFLMRTLVNPTAPNPGECAIYWSGYTDCLKFFYSTANEHKQRILSCQE